VECIYISLFIIDLFTVILCPVCTADKCYAF